VTHENYAVTQTKTGVTRRQIGVTRINSRFEFTWGLLQKDF